MKDPWRLSCALLLIVGIIIGKFATQIKLGILSLTPDIPQSEIAATNIYDSGCAESWMTDQIFSPNFRDGEKTKIKFAVFEGGGVGGREKDCLKALVFLGNATKQIWIWKFDCRGILLSWRRLLKFLRICHSMWCGWNIRMSSPRASGARGAQLFSFTFLFSLTCLGDNMCGLMITPRFSIIASIF